MTQARVLVTHNGLSYDWPVLESVYGFKPPPGRQLYDTLVASRAIFSWLPDEEEIARYLAKAGQAPSAGRFPVPPGGKGWEPHALRSWGHRMSFPKDEYTGGFDTLNADLIRYCQRDTQVTARLFDLLQAEPHDRGFLKLEHQVALIMQSCHERGFPVDIARLEGLIEELQTHYDAGVAELRRIIPAWEYGPAYKKDNTKKGIKAGDRRMMEFSPANKNHIIKFLTERFGWTPRKNEMTPTGQPQINDDILARLPYPEVELIRKCRGLAKGLSMIATGSESWANCIVEGADGVARIHARYKASGDAVTGRMSCSSPNLQQVPRGSQYRSVFIPTPGWLLLGLDFSGIELRMLAHFLQAHDQGAYIKAILSGDIHEINRQAMGLRLRPTAKVAAFARLYGAGNDEIGRHVFGELPEEDKARILTLPADKVADAITNMGSKAIEAFDRNTKGLPELRAVINAKYLRDGFLLAPDGRRLRPCAALPTQFLAAGHCRLRAEAFPRRAQPGLPRGAVLVGRGAR